jgi:hypothetical protein
MTVGQLIIWENGKILFLRITGQEIDDEAGFHGERLSPGVALRQVGRVARQGLDQRGGGTAEVRRTAVSTRVSSPRP